MSKNMVQEQTDRWWFSNQKMIVGALKKWMDGDDSTLRTILASRFEAGARWNFRETSAASPYISRFLEMCILLGPINEFSEPTQVPNETRSAEPCNRCAKHPIEHCFCGVHTMQEHIQIHAAFAEYAANEMRRLHIES